MGGEWREASLGDVVELKRGYDLPQQQREAGKIPIVSSSGTSGYHNRSMVKGPGVVTGRYGTIGQVFFIDEDFWPLNTTLYVKDFKGNDPRFVSYFLQSIDYLAYSDKAAVPGVNRNHLHEAAVFYPVDYVEQRAIAHVLSTFDDKIALNRKMNETLEAMARALFQSWFVDFDPVRAKAEGRDPGLPAHIAALFPDSFEDHIPRGWHIAPLLSDAMLLSGGTPKTNNHQYWNGDIPWASAKDVSQSSHQFLVGTARHITSLGLNNSATQLIPAFATVVVARGATTGRMVLLGKEMAMNQTCYAVNSRTNQPFTLHCLLREHMDRLVHAAHGSVFDTITTSTLAQANALRAPDAVLDSFEMRVAPLFKRILANVEQSQTLADARDTLLPKLISGELRVGAADRSMEVVI